MDSVPAIAAKASNISDSYGIPINHLLVHDERPETCT